MFFGYEKHKKGTSYIFVADPEKAVIDSIYLGAITEEIVGEIRNRLDEEKLARYVRQFKGKGRKKIERWLL